MFAKAYDVLYHYLQGNSRKNELYIAKHIDFFQTQFDLGVSLHGRMASILYTMYRFTLLSF